MSELRLNDSPMRPELENSGSARRRIRPDLFSIFVLALASGTLVAQIVLVIWLHRF